MTSQTDIEHWAERNDYNLSFTIKDWVYGDLIPNQAGISFHVKENTREEALNSLQPLIKAYERIIHAAHLRVTDR